MLILFKSHSDTSTPYEKMLFLVHGGARGNFKGKISGKGLRCIAALDSLVESGYSCDFCFRHAPVSLIAQQLAQHKRNTEGSRAYHWYLRQNRITPAAYRLLRDQQNSKSESAWHGSWLKYLAYVRDFGKG